MTITAIKAQVRRSGRVSVYVDSAYSFSLSDAQLLDAKIYTGLVIDKARLDELKKLSDFGKMYERVLNFVMIRPRSVREVQDYCRRKQCSPEDAAIILDKLNRLGYVNDASFARAWVEHRRLGKPMSRRRLRLELKQKGITDEIIATILDASEFDELSALHRLIAKKRRLARYQDEQKLMQYLARQGFGFDEIRQALAET